MSLRGQADAGRRRARHVQVVLDERQHVLREPRRPGVASMQRAARIEGDGVFMSLDLLLSIRRIEIVRAHACRDTASAPVPMGATLSTAAIQDARRCLVAREPASP